MCRRRRFVSLRSGFSRSEAEIRDCVFEEEARGASLERVEGRGGSGIAPAELAGKATRARYSTPGKMRDKCAFPKASGLQLRERLMRLPFRARRASESLMNSYSMLLLGRRHGPGRCLAVWQCMLRTRLSLSCETSRAVPLTTECGLRR